MEKKHVLKLVAMAGVCATFVFVPASLAFSDYSDDLLVDSYYNDILNVVSQQDTVSGTGGDILVGEGDSVRGSNYSDSYYEESSYVGDDILVSDGTGYSDYDYVGDDILVSDSGSGYYSDDYAPSSDTGSGSSYTVTYSPSSINGDILISKPAKATPIPTPDPASGRTVKSAMVSDSERSSIADNTKAPIDTASAASSIESVINQVNQLRASAGVAPLNADSVLNYVAAQRVKETTKKFSHTRPNGKNSVTILSDYGVDVGRSGENIACCISTPEGVVAAWNNSSAHKRCMLNPDYTNAGVGTVVSGGCTYWVLILTN